MKKTNKKKNKTTFKYAIFLIIATLFMSIGYAQVNNINLNINGEVDTIIQENVFITDATLISNENSNLENCKVNYITGSTLSSYIELDQDINSTIQYKVNLYNNSNMTYLFIEALTDTTGDELSEKLYSNQNIEYSLIGLQDYTTTIAPGGEMEFIITFSFKPGADITKNTLSSILNFRFLPLPTIELSNEGEIYTIDNIYPGYTKEFEFTIDNYNDQNINNVPLLYSFVTNIPEPLSIEIYDENDNLVTNNLLLDGDGTTKVSKKYKLKVLWKYKENIDYTQYQNKTYEFKVTLNAIPNYEKYLDYKIEKVFNINTTVAPFYFGATSDTSAKIINNKATLSVKVNNYESDTNYNIFDTTYKISIEDNSKFTVSVNGITSENNTIVLKGNELKQDSFNAILEANIVNLNPTETLTLKITSQKPYYQEISVPITISLQPVTVSFNANGGTMTSTTISSYNGRAYGTLPTPTRKGYTFNGWYTAASGGTKCTSTTLISNDASHTLYAQWTPILLAQNVSVGDYVSYPVNYSNVATNPNGTLTATSTGWRVVGIVNDDTGNYVRLISAGIPMTYRHPNVTTYDVTTKSQNNLTTDFFSTPINTTITDYQFNLCGFKNASGGSITTIAQLKTLFTNDYTQIESGIPKVRSVIKEDLQALGVTIANLTDLRESYLFGVKAATAAGSYSYAGYYMGSKYNSYYMWATYYSGYIVYTFGINGVRPVVTLKTNVVKTGGSGSASNPHTIGL